MARCPNNGSCASVIAPPAAPPHGHWLDTEECLWTSYLLWRTAPAMPLQAPPRASFSRTGGRAVEGRLPAPGAAPKIRAAKGVLRIHDGCIPLVSARLCRTMMEGGVVINLRPSFVYLYADLSNPFHTITEGRRQCKAERPGMFEDHLT